MSARATRPRLSVKLLEDRTLLNGHTLASAALLPFSNNVAQAAGFLQHAQDVDLFKVQLNKGDKLTAAVSAQQIGSGLDAVLRIFDGTGNPVASNHGFTGRDPQLTFQSPADGGIYYVGVSGFADPYDPHAPAEPAGASTGTYALTLRDDPGATLQPDLRGASFTIDQTAAAWGDALTVRYTVENRGGQDAASFPVEVVLSTNNRFDGSGSDMVLLGPATDSPLPAGSSIASGSLTVTLPDMPPPGFAGLTQVYLGLHIGTGTYPNSPEHGNDWEALNILTPVAVNEPNDAIDRASILPINARVNGALGPGDHADFFRLSLTETGRLTARVHADAGLHTRLSLYDAQGRLLVQSDGQSPENLDDLIVQHLEGSAGGTTYFLKVQGIGGGAGSYSLTTEFVAGLAPFKPFPVGSGPEAVVAGDFNGDGQLDLAVLNYGVGTVTILLGNGDGTFRSAPSIQLQGTPFQLVSGDFTGDGRADLAVTYYQPSSGGNVAEVLLGNGDGTFSTTQAVPIGGTAPALATGDFDGDGRADLAVSYYQTSSSSSVVAILLGNQAGTLSMTSATPIGGKATALVAGNFDQDGRTDLAVVTVAGIGDGTVSVLDGDGSGGFESIGTAVPVGNNPNAIVAGDFTGRGPTDLAVANAGDGTVTVLLNNGNGVFRAAGLAVPVARSSSISALVAGDFGGDGTLDLAVAKQYGAGLDGTVTVLLGDGHGNFHSASSVVVGQLPLALIPGDFNGDGRTDVAVANYGNSTVTVLPGKGNGFFVGTGAVPTGLGPDAVVTGDFNGDGQADLAVANFGANTISVLLGNGDGTFQNGGTLSGELSPIALVAGDFNGDGRIDLAVVHEFFNTVTVLLGNGDGTFRRVEPDVPVGNLPDALVAFKDNGIIYLAVANAFGNSVTVLKDDGHGNFQSTGPAIPVGNSPSALVAGHFTGSGHTDLAVANYQDGTVTVLRGTGDGHFQPDGEVIPVGQGPQALAAADFNGDGLTDLAVANRLDNTVTVLGGDGHGNFIVFTSPPVGFSPDALVGGDFTGDGKTDLAVANFGDGTVTVLRSDGHGNFTFGPAVGAGTAPEGLVAGNFTGVGTIDLAVTNSADSSVTVLLGAGQKSFFAAGQISNSIQATPIVADLTGDGVADVAVLRQDGRILFRRGRSGEAGVFDPPIIVNPPPASGDPTQDHPARDLVTVTRNGHIDLAALDATDSFVSLYSFDQATGTFTRTVGPQVPGLLPVRIASGDLNGEPPGPDGFGNHDLVVAAAGSNQVFVYFQQPNGTFGVANAEGGFDPNYSRDVGVSPLGIALVSLAGDPRPDIVVTNQFSGDVSILRNDVGQSFSEERFRAGDGPYGLGTLIENGPLGVQSQERSTAIAGGTFGPGSVTGVVVIDAGSDNASILLDDGVGGLFNPQALLTLPAGLDPVAIAAGDFNGDQNLDLAILDRGTQTILIFLGDGHGRFTEKVATDADGNPIPLSAGNAPTGLTVQEVDEGDGHKRVDLLVGNAFGDVLRLQGNGDGTFRQYRRLDLQTALTEVDPQHFVISDPSQDAVVIKNLQGVASFQQQRAQGIRAPGAVGVADAGDGTRALVVANGGGNDVLVYLGDSQGRFDPTPAQTLSVGTDPVGITVGTVDVNGQSEVAVFVANQGSNDVSVLLGSGTGIGWRLTEAERLQVGDGPVSTTMATVNGVQQLVVTDSLSNDVRLLPSRGQGFFSDQPQDVTILPAGLNPVQSLVGNFDGTGLGLLTVNAGSNDLSFFPEFSTAGEKTISLGAAGDRPDAAVAVDVNGVTDLFVANDGNGAIALLQTGAGGPELAATFSLAEVPHPTALALVEVGGLTQVYVTTEGQDRVFLLASFAPEGVPGLPAGGIIPSSTGESDLARADQTEPGTNDTNPPITEEPGPGRDVVVASSPVLPNAAGDPAGDTGPTPATEESPLTDDLMTPRAPAETKDDTPPGPTTQRGLDQEGELLADALFSRWFDIDPGAESHPPAESSWEARPTRAGRGEIRASGHAEAAMPNPDPDQQNSTLPASSWQPGTSATERAGIPGRVAIGEQRNAVVPSRDGMGENSGPDATATPWSRAELIDAWFGGRSNRPVAHGNNYQAIARRFVNTASSPD